MILGFYDTKCCMNGEEKGSILSENLILHFILECHLKWTEISNKNEKKKWKKRLDSYGIILYI